MKLFVAIYDDCALLPHFMRHYARLGVRLFHIAASREIMPIVLRDTAGYRALVRDDLDVAESFQGGASAVSAMRAEYSTPDEWVLIVDLDEFLAEDVSMTRVLERAAAEGANVVRARMVDRVAADGSFPEITPATDLWSTFPVECALTSMLQGSVDHKGVFVRGHLEPAMAHHEFTEERLASEWLRLHHFKWNSNVVARLQLATTLAKASGINWWVEYDRVLRHLEQHGRIRCEEFPPPH